MKKYLFMLTALILAVSLAGCNNGIDNPEYTTADNGTQIITENTAMRAAAEKANLASEDVRYTNVAYGTTENGNKYDVGFLHEGYEYSVTVDADNGKIESFEKNEITGIIDEETALGKAITESDIEALILADGEAFDKEKLADVEIELDKDDNEFEYEIEFKYETAKCLYAYEIEINAVDGSLKESECKPFAKDENGNLAGEADDDKDDDIEDSDDKDDEDDIDDDDKDDNSVEIGETLPQESLGEVFEESSDIAHEESSDIAVEDSSAEASEDISFEISEDVSENDVPVDKPIEKPIEIPENIIGEDAALNAALAKAELADVAKEMLNNFKLKLDEDDGAFEYDIDFCYNGMKYEIDVDALTGDILDFESKEIMNPEEKPDNRPEHKPENGENSGSGTDTPPVEESKPPVEEGKPPVEESIPPVEESIPPVEESIPPVEDSKPPIEDSKPPIEDSTLISEKDAYNIALQHSGVDESTVEKLHIHLDRKHGKNEYEIEFVSGYTEYDYDIDAVTGEIISFDKDAESCDAPDFSKPSEDEFIGKEAALNAAYAHAGINAEDVSDIEVELEKGRGVFKYEIEFKCGNTEYEYDINALDGTVIQFASEIDD